MDKIMEKFNKLSLPAVILIASIVLGGLFYASQVSKQRSIEKQQQIKIEQEKQDQLAKELKEQQAKEEAEQALNTCIVDASSDYSDRWHKECKAQGKLTSRCIDIKELSFDEYLKKYDLSVDEYKAQRNIADDNALAPFLDYFKRRSDECSCRLLVSTADRFNESLEKDKDDCFKRYPQK